MTDVVDVTDEQVRGWQDEAYRKGADAALTMASYVVLPDQLAACLLGDEGDDVDLAEVGYPNLSGEWADDPTPDALYREVTGRDPYAPGTDYHVVALADAWEAGRDAVWRDALVAFARRLSGDVAGALVIERRNDEVAKSGTYPAGGGRVMPVTTTLRDVIAELAAYQVREAHGWWVECEPEEPMDDDAGSVEYVRSGEGMCVDVALRGPTRDHSWGDVLNSTGNVVIPATTAPEENPYVRSIVVDMTCDALVWLRRQESGR